MNNNNLETLSNVQRILNKINNDNSQVLIEKILSKCQDQIKDQETAITIVNRIFLKVNEEFNLLSIYIELVNKLSIIFNQNLSLNIGNIFMELFYKEINNLKSLSQQNLVVEIRRKVMNYSKFIGECYKFKIFSKSFFSDILKLLLTQDILEQLEVPSQQPIDFNKIQLLQIESLATILAIVGKSITEQNSSQSATPSQIAANSIAIDKEIEESIQSAIHKLIDNKSTNLPPRVRFMFKNLMELKNNKWVISSASKGPSDSDIQLQKELVHLAQSYGKSINKTLQDKCGTDEALQTIFWKKLFQSFSSMNYKIFKELFIEEKSNSLTSSPNVPLSPFFLRTIASPIQLSLNSIHNNNSSASNNNNSNTNSNQLNPPNLTITIPKFQNLMDIDNNLPNGFISPKISRPGQTSPLLSSIQKSETDTIVNPTSLHLNINNNIVSTEQHSSISNNVNNNNDRNYNNNQNQSVPMEEDTNDLSIILSIIDSKIWNPQKEIWKKKIINKIYPLRSTLKKKQKVEILAAIWQNMCDNQDEYGSYLDLCLTLIKMDEGESVNSLVETDSISSLSSTLSSNSSHYQYQTNIPSTNTKPQHPSHHSQSSSQQPPTNNLISKVLNQQSGGRRSSMAVIQMKPSINLETRRSSISVISELSRRGSMSCDTPNSCPPAPKLRSTPTLKSTPHKKNSISDPMDITTPIANSTTTTTTTTVTNTNDTNNSLKKQIKVEEEEEEIEQPISKKHKPNESESFYTVLMESLQDDLALKMFVKKKSLTVYMELLKDLYREFIIEIPILLKCISLVHNGLYELSDEECTLLFDLEELAQEQKNLEDENKSQNLLKKNNQFYQWKTDTWEEDQQSPPPPPSSYYDLSSDVFVL